MKAEREPSLDLLKILASTCIVFHHYQQTFRDMPRQHFDFYSGSFYFGYLVELFFLISGFLMFRYIRKIENGLSFRRFFLRRYLRFFPLMAFSTLVYAIMSWSFFYDSFRITGELHGLMGYERPSFYGMISNALGLIAIVGPANTGINNPLWYLSTLLGCCLLFYVFVRLAVRLRLSPYVFFVAAIILGISLCDHPYENLPFLSSSMARGYRSFFPGLILASILDGRRAGPKITMICAGIVLLFFGALHYSYPAALMKPGAGHLLSLFIWPALLIFALSSPVSRILSRLRLSHLGRISYDVYVWHDVLILLAVILGECFGLNPFFFSLRGMFLYSLGIWLFGAFSHFCIDTPLSQLTGRILNMLPD